MSVFFSGPDIYCTAPSLSSQTPPPLHSFPICGTRMNILHTDCGNARWLCGNGVCADPCVRINDEAKWALAEQNKVQGKLAKAVNVCRVDLISIHHSVSLWATLVFNLNYNFQVPSNQCMAFPPPNLPRNQGCWTLAQTPMGVSACPVHHSQAFQNHKGRENGHW